MAVAYNALASLPEAVLLLIIHHLRPASQRNLRLACQTLSRIVSGQYSRLKVTAFIDSIDSAQLHRKFPGITELYLSSHLEHAEVIAFVAINQKLLKQLKVLHLPKCCHWGEPDLALFLCFAGSCRSLECITNDCIDRDTPGYPGMLSPWLVWSLGDLCSLKVLDLHSFFSSNMGDGHLQGITGLTALTQLKLNAAGCSTGLTALKSLGCLHRLAVCGVHDECGELFEALVCLSTLTALELDCMEGQEGMTEVLQSISLVTQLQQLTLSSICNVGYEGWAALCHLHLLKHLSVSCDVDSGCPLELYVPLKALTHLTCLYLDADLGQLDWLKHYVELQQLEVCVDLEDPGSDMLQPLGCLTNLRSLQLEIFLSQQDNRLTNILQPLSALKQLQQFRMELSGVTVALTLCDLTALASLPALSKLSFSDLPRLPADDEQRLPSFHAVTEVEADSCFVTSHVYGAAASGYLQMDDVQLLLLCKLAPNVRRLKLQGMDRRVSPGGFTAALEQLPRLTSLRLCKVKDLPDQAFASIRRVTGLEELTLEECETLSLTAVAALLQVSSLQFLRIQTARV